MNADSASFFESLSPERRAECEQLAQLVTEATGEPAKMWSGNIVGFGARHYKYESGREGDTMKIGFASRKNDITLYGVIFYGDNRELLDQLGKHTTGKGCLHIKRLSDVNLQVLRTMIETAYNSHKA